MFEFIKKMKLISLNNRTGQTRPTLVGINSNKTNFYQFNVSVNKCGGSCSTIEDPYVPVCVPKQVKM